jgi:hypothetical protein
MGNAGFEEGLLHEKQESEGGSDESKKEKPTPARWAKKSDEHIILKLGMVSACHGINKSSRDENMSSIVDDSFTGKW